MTNFEVHYCVEAMQMTKDTWATEEFLMDMMKTGHGFASVSLKIASYQSSMEHSLDKRSSEVFVEINRGEDVHNILIASSSFSPR